MTNINKKPELLAPAGGWEQLFYALHFGADAVYLATDKYGLRQRAKNFSLDDLPRAVEMAHAAGAKVYVTCNSYAHDADLEDLPRYISAMARAGIDAVILSDLGVLSVVRRVAPELAIHVSTQASVSNSAAARMWYELGAKRIVCAREMSLTEIAQFKREIPAGLEVEVFVQGAMCMAISGRCLISDYLAQRPANQGHCVQPCRWEYALVEPTRQGEYFPIEQDATGTHIMNSKDLNMLSHLDELRDAGVDSIKIEGRVKKAFYVATVVNAYRQVLDGADALQWQRELETISHRPYSTGFFYGPAQQSFEEDVYVQHYDWVAEVVSCKPCVDNGLCCEANEAEAPKGKTDAAPCTEAVDAKRDSCGPLQMHCVQVRCRNRFYEGDELEVLSPHVPVSSIVVHNLHECFLDAETSEVINQVPAQTASKAMGDYCFEVPVALHEHDILRVRRKDPSKKN